MGELTTQGITGRFRIGDIVIVRRGKYAGKPFSVIGAKDDRILIANGAEYTAAKPKKKNVIHLQQTHYNIEDVAGRVAGGKPLDNGWLMQKISNLLENSGTSREQEDETAEWPKKK
ncbi:MAG: KOW domain-containing RNA-binding protein [Synergistes sp.]|nr:KOW domain-containing RNA-binding protein [Synergistes sp.]